ncbi:MAG: nuclear transport factor 2 family protein [Actinomycetota bacterium]|nr:nuclear transport factor 2 family protein [Actinomycetota bacterium]
MNLPKPSVAELFEDHMQAEMDGDLERTMATMGPNPHLNHVPVRAGGSGQRGVREFYDAHLVGKFFPPDVEITNISRTTDTVQMVDELLVRFTHTQAIDWILPGVPATGRSVQIPLVVIVRADAGLVTHEHIYWDQAAVLVQIGLIDPAGLPVTGADQAAQINEPTGAYRSEY